MGRWDGDKILGRNASYTLIDKEEREGWTIQVISHRTEKAVGTYKYERGDYFSRQRALKKARDRSGFE